MIGRTRPRRSGLAGSPADVSPPVGTGAATPADVVARLVPLDPGLYAFGVLTGPGGGAAGLALPAIHVAAPPQHSDAIEISDVLGRRSEWLGGQNTALFVKAPAGGAALITAHLARDPRTPPLVLEIHRLDGPSEAASAATTLSLGGPAPEQAPAWSSIEIIAHIRGRGDMRFVDAVWAGRLGPGMWLESFAVLPQDPAIATAIEYKGQAADGSETAWLAAGARCGAPGQGLPLIGFAVRQKAVPGGTRVDCEYSGSFASGATTGPMRNGAPCRSTRDNDPLEGMQLRLTRLPPRPAAQGA